jgi:DsbC/DsbD-like thiol-disulfide interchange protein
LAVAPPEPLTVKRGSTAVENLKVEVLPGFHVNSDHPRDEFLIPLKLTWQGAPLETKSITFPKPEEIQVGNDHLVVFTGTFDIRTEFAVPRNAPAGSTTITGKLRYQACSNQMCFRPASLEIKLPVTVE